MRIIAPLLFNLDHSRGFCGATLPRLPRLLRRRAIESPSDRNAEVAKEKCP